VTNADIAEALKAKGFAVEKSAVRMPEGPLKVVGETQLVVSLHTDVTATINVAVVGES
jgi:large subunit ribosomal protein L9